LTVDWSEGFGQVSRSMNLLRTDQYLAMRREAIKNDGYSALLANHQYDIAWPDVKMWDTTRNTNWQKKLIGGTAHITNAQVSLSGGTSNTQFLFGGGYYRESTVFPGSNFFQRFSGKVNLNHVSDDNRLKMNVTVNYTYSSNNVPSTDFTALCD